jgi:uncharacterized repeat protein (TIGR03943 family)
MRRDTQGVVLLLVGATLLKVAFAGTYVRYVKPSQFPLLVIGGVVLVAIAVTTVWRQIRDVLPRAGSHRESSHRARAEAAGLAAAAHEGLDPVSAPPSSAESAGSGSLEDVEPEADTPDDAHDRSRVGWLLLAPALALLLFSPPALGAFQASRNGTALSVGSTSDFAPLPAGDPVPLTLLDYASRAVFDKGRSLTGHTVKLTGFVIAGPQGQPYLARMFVGCCAADARPVKVGLAGELPDGLKSEQWLVVTGTYTDYADRDLVNGEVIPYVTADSVILIPAPDEPYET